MTDNQSVKLTDIFSLYDASADYRPSSVKVHDEQGASHLSSFDVRCLPCHLALMRGYANCMEAMHAPATSRRFSWAMRATEHTIERASTSDGGTSAARHEASPKIESHPQDRAQSVYPCMGVWFQKLWMGLRQSLRKVF